MTAARRAWRPRTSVGVSCSAAGLVVTVTLIHVAVLSPASAQSMPDTENGRYTLAPVSDGVLRLDTRTGVMSTCTNKYVGWACYAMPDERTAFDTEVGRLQRDNEKLRSENEKLKATLAQRDVPATGKTHEALPKEDSLQKHEPRTGQGERKLELPLPSDQDIDRAMSFLERAWRRLVEIANRIQGDPPGKI